MTSTTQPTRGMVLGKFLPPHNGHMFLFNFARNYVDELTIVVESLPDQPIPGELRYQWVCEMFPMVQVVHLTDANPQDPSEHPDFWSIWQNSLERILPYPVDFVFASEDYGWKLAEVLAAQFIPVDISRVAVPVSGTKIRENPMQYWDFIPPIVRSYFAKRICIFGPESTGKSTLTQQLAKHFQTSFVPEYARIHLESRGGKIELADIPLIAKGQMAAEDALASQGDKLLFCDTDLIATTIWSDWLFGECPSWVADEASRRHYDLYLLTDVDVPWVADDVRYLPEERKSFLKRCEAELIKRNRPYIKLSGDWNHRFEKAVAAVGELL